MNTKSRNSKSNCFARILVIPASLLFLFVSTLKANGNITYEEKLNAESILNHENKDIAHASFIIPHTRQFAEVGYLDTVPVRIPAPAPISKPNRIYTKVEVEAEFPGGQSAWKKYISNVIQKNKKNFTEEDYGTCIVKFIVDEEGNISRVKATTMSDTNLAEVAVDAIMNGPKWIPGEQGGHKVASFTLQPVTLKKHFE